MNRKLVSLTKFFSGIFLLLTMVFAVLPAGADQEPNQEPNQVPETVVPDSGPLSLPAATEPDTVRTNIWLTEALMAEIVSSTARVLPPPPAAIQLVQQGKQVEDKLFRSAAVRVLGGLGYELYQPGDDPANQAAVDCIYSFSVDGVELKYPEVGRTLGLWRRWVDRQLEVTAEVEVTMASSGRLLLSDRVQRRFNDRVAAGDFDTVESQIYDFTTAETAESGWKGRLEEIFVLGTLASLVAIYFANTGG